MLTHARPLPCLLLDLQVAAHVAGAGAEPAAAVGGSADGQGRPAAARKAAAAPGRPVKKVTIRVRAVWLVGHYPRGMLIGSRMQPSNGSAPLPRPPLRCLQEPADLAATSEGEESSGAEDEPVEDANPQALVSAGAVAYRCGWPGW